MAASALLLSGPLGLGHEMPVRSFTDVLAKAGWRVRSRDSMSLLGDGAGRAGQRVFDRLMTVPGVYDGLHFAQFRTGGRVARLAERLAARPAVPRLRAELERDPVDLVLSVFATGALAAAELRGQRSGAARRAATGPVTPEFRAVVYCPDVAAHKLWVHEGTDLFLVSSPAAAASVRRFLPRAPIALVPSPVRAAFYDAPGQPAARHRLGIPAAAGCALLIDSGWGFAPLPAAAAALADAGVHVLAVAGRNARAERALRRLAATRPLLRPFGFTDQVPALMAAADVVVALPGAATCAEARVVGRGLLLLDVMPGHGRDNLLHELEQGNAEACGPAAADIAASARAMLDSRGLDSRGLGGSGPDGQNGAPRTPRWEPAFAAALASIGLDVPLTDTDTKGPAACVPSSLTRRATRASTAGPAPATRRSARSAPTGTRRGWRSPRRSCPTACSWTPRRPASPSPTSSRSRPAGTWRSCTRARPRSRATSRWRRR
jgi:processive 1,2-diacylglycerol beta-glucosyltransferase